MYLRMDVISCKADPDTTDYARLQQRLLEAEPHPDMVYYCSSSEVYCWHDPLTRTLGNALREAYADVPHRLISQGCLSFLGLILDFTSRRDVTDAIVVVSEPEHLTQHLMDCIGIGRTNGADSLIHAPALGAVRLRKAPQPDPETDAVYIAGCDILSKRPGVSATVSLVDRLVDILRQPTHQTPRPVVSFQTQSSFSTHLLDLAQHKLARAQAPIRWLDSIDAGDWHYMSMKPMLELQRYRDVLADGELTLAVLGVGGRFGVLDLHSPSEARPWRDRPACGETASFRSGYDASFEVLHAEPEQRIELARQHLKCTTRGETCPDNHYYGWDFDKAPLAAPVQYSPLMSEVTP